MVTCAHVAKVNTLNNTFIIFYTCFGLVLFQGNEGFTEGSLKEGKMEFLSRKKCDALYQNLGLTLTDRMSCTYNKGKVTPCGVSSDRYH